MSTTIPTKHDCSKKRQRNGGLTDKQWGREDVREEREREREGWREKERERDGERKRERGMECAKERKGQRCSDPQRSRPYLGRQVEREGLCVCVCDKNVSVFV